MVDLNPSHFARSQAQAYPLGHKWECRLGSSSFLSFSKLELLTLGLPSQSLVTSSMVDLHFGDHHG